jgi:hypothetical protein
LIAKGRLTDEQADWRARVVADISLDLRFAFAPVFGIQNWSERLEPAAAWTDKIRWIEGELEARRAQYPELVNKGRLTEAEARSPDPRDRAAPPALLGAAVHVGAADRPGARLSRRAPQQRNRPARDPDELREAAQGVIERMSSTYKARNGKTMGIQGDDGEMCWIVHSDDIETLRTALSRNRGDVGHG